MTIDIFNILCKIPKDIVLSIQERRGDVRRVLNVKEVQVCSNCQKHGIFLSECKRRVIHFHSVEEALEIMKSGRIRINKPDMAMYLLRIVRYQNIPKKTTSEHIESLAIECPIFAQRRVSVATIAKPSM